MGLPSQEDHGDSAPTRHDVLIQLIQTVGVCLQSDGSGEQITQLFTFMQSFNQENYVSGDTYNVTQAGAVGPNSTSHSSSFNVNQVNLPNDIDLNVLMAQLVRLRSAMQTRADSPEQYLALANVGLAEKAAAEDDKQGVVANLAKVGKWALEVATEIGTKVAAAAITHASGL